MAYHDLTLTGAQLDTALGQAHGRQHAITSALDHTSTATAGQVLKADANGLPVDGTNTDAEVSAAVTASHAQNTDTSVGGVAVAEGENSFTLAGGTVGEKTLTVDETKSISDKLNKALFDANSILAADSDDTPAAVTVAEQRVVGRITGGNITALTAAQINTLLGTRAISYSQIYVDAGAMVPCTTNPAEAGTKEYGTNDIDTDYFAFDGGATEERVQFKLVMPEDYDLSTVKAKFYWTSATGSTAGDTVEWGIKAGAITDDGAIDAAMGTAVTVSDTLLADAGADLQISAATGAMTIGGTPALGKLVVFEVYRNTDGSDDMAEDAQLLGVAIQYGQIATAMAAW
jgi:hypothetical protein